MPSMETDVASVVRQDNCTWSPAEITVGVAVSRAVGAAAAAGGGAACAGGNGFCFLHPETATKATSRKIGTRTRFRIFNVVLPSRDLDFCPGDSVSIQLYALFKLVVLAAISIQPNLHPNHTSAITEVLRVKLQRFSSNSPDSLPPGQTALQLRCAFPQKNLISQ